MFIDTHCHLDLITECNANEAFLAKKIEEAKTIIDESTHYNVTSVITIGTNVDSSKLSNQFANHISQVFASVGIHPCDTTGTLTQEIMQLKKLLDQDTNKRIVGIGEIGLDFYHPGFDIPTQERFFRAQIKLAIEYNLPIIIHSRNAFAQTIRILDEYKASSLRGVFHCFSENLEAAKQALDRGFRIGVDGHITYPKNQYIRDAIAYAGPTNILLETDAPFLAPQIVRGTKNHPKNIALIAQFLCTQMFHNETMHTLAVTTQNTAHNLFPALKN